MYEDKFRYLISSTIPKEGEISVKDSHKCLNNFYKLKRVIGAEDLANLDYIFFKSVEYFANIEGILTKPMLFGYLTSAMDSLMKSDYVKVNEIIASDTHTYNLDIDGDFETAKREIMTLLAELYDELQEINTTEHEFNSMLKLYADELYHLNYLQVLQQAAIIANQGQQMWFKGKRETLKGPDDSYDFFTRNVTVLKSKFSLEEDATIDTSGDVSQIHEADKKQETLFDVITNTGIAPIDNALKDFRRTQLLGIEAGAGVGKTRFSRWIAYRAVTMFKKNVFDITMEQEHTEIWALYVSTHLFVKYNVYLPDSNLKRNIVPDELAHLVQIAKYDLFTNPDYGKLRITAKDLYIEEAFEYLTGVHRAEFQYDMLLLDYASLVDTKAQSKYGAEMHEIVTQVYKRTKRDICRKLKVFGLVINQLARQGVEKLAKGENTTTYDASNSGETYKSTDANLVLSSNQSLERDGKIRITSPKFRDAEKFYNVYATAKIGCSYFAYDDEEEIDEAQFEEALQGATA